MSPMRSGVLNISLSLVIAIPVGWIMAFMATPLLWRLEGFSGLELAGHSGPADIVTLVLIFLTWVLFCICGWSLIKRKRAAEDGPET